MKIHILSDLHDEFGKFSFPLVDRDLLVLAGDINIGTRALQTIEKECKKSPVVYVLGNHEYYNQDFAQTLKAWRSIQMDNFYFLENASIILDNIRIVGATLWTDMNHRDLKTMDEARLAMNDYQIVNKGELILQPEDTVDCFDQSWAYIQTELTQKFNGKTIVLTHHLPSYGSIAPEFQGNRLNPSFASDLDGFVMQYPPDYWIHGHTHVSIDYMLKNTRIICNPRGYWPNDLNIAFKPNLILQF